GSYGLRLFSINQPPEFSKLNIEKVGKTLSNLDSLISFLHQNNNDSLVGIVSNIRTTIGNIDTTLKLLSGLPDPDSLKRYIALVDSTKIDSLIKTNINKDENSFYSLSDLISITQDFKSRLQQDETGFLYANDFSPEKFTPLFRRELTNL